MVGPTPSSLPVLVVHPEERDEQGEEEEEGEVEGRKRVIQIFLLCLIRYLGITLISVV